MTKSKASERDSIEADARARVRRDERALRRGLTLGQAFEEFRRHPSPWMIGTTLVGAVIARIVVGDWQPTDLLVPAVMLAMFPVFEWIVHVTVLHWRPRRLGPIALDSELARKHREHHVDPRDIPLIFIPTKTLSVLVVVLVALALFAFPRLGLGLTFLITITLLGLGYEWTHYLVHTDYKPKGSLYRAVWRNHRHHHYKNEHYWFTVTSSGTADRLFGTYPDPATTETSPTARNLHSA
ncbi:sterol desaturase family protein [Nocardia gipuzkoensis]|uniref:sterol desaturase family protein n=1 Tax=Nocardia gipuzkoensis TaxID=2749991 RepID=UPI001E4F1605|nr:sterol desaturase family protein [Nocardia gipuzkoensis]UGT71067.1 sterol desaturase family protein [Nocardia gipuzkoensis]